MAALSVTWQLLRVATTANGLLNPCAVYDEERRESPGDCVESGDEDSHPRRDSGEPEPDPAEHLRIPQKGYRVHLAVSPNPYGGIQWLSSRSW